MQDANKVFVILLADAWKKIISRFGILNETKYGIQIKFNNLQIVAQLIADIYKVTVEINSWQWDKYIRRTNKTKTQVFTSSIVTLGLLQA